MVIDTLSLFVPLAVFVRAGSSTYASFLLVVLNLDFPHTDLPLPEDAVL